MLINVFLIPLIVTVTDFRFLNKLTVEKFDILVHQLVNIGINTENVLKGIIILIFEKALDEPKFCSMYARVCERFAADGPNFEDVSDGADEGQKEVSRRTPTFLKLLLRKCQDEFENRSRAEQLAAAVGSFSDCKPGTEEYRQTIAAHAELKAARAKMLGNVRFIGELGKLKLLSEKVLHKCIQQLCVEVENPVTEDVECLCQLMKTVGQQLDHDKAQSYMDQYFERIVLMRESGGLQPRIRFMIDDVIELRDNNWVERKLQQQSGPKSIHEIHLEAMEEQLQAPGMRRDKQMHMQHIRLLRHKINSDGGVDGTGFMGAGVYDEMPDMPLPLREHGIPSQPGMFSGMQRRDLLVPQRLMQHSNSGDDLEEVSVREDMSGGSSPYGPMSDRLGGSGGSAHNNNRSGYNSTTPPLGRSPPSHYDNRDQHNRGTQSRQHNGQGHGFANPNPLRSVQGLRNIGKSGIRLGPGGGLKFGSKGANGNVRSSSPGVSDTRQIVGNVQVAPSKTVPSVQPAMPVMGLKLNAEPKKMLESRTNAAVQQQKNKKPSKEQLETMANALIEEYLTALDVDEALKCFADMKTPKYAMTLAQKAILVGLDRSTTDRRNICRLIAEFVGKNVLSGHKLLSTIEDDVLPMLDDLAIDIPLVREYIGVMMSHWIVYHVQNENAKMVLSLKDVAEVLQRGLQSVDVNMLSQHHVILGHVLKGLIALVNNDTTKTLYEDADIDVRGFLPVGSRADGDVIAFVDMYSVPFLYQDLKMRRDFMAQLATHLPVNDAGTMTDASTDDSNAGIKALHKWLQGLSADLLKMPKFVFHVAYTVFEYIASNTCVHSGTGNLKVESKEWKKMKANEKQQYQTIAPLLSSMASKSVKKQKQIVYALQQYCHAAAFPKGLMLRGSGHLYDNDVVEEDAFSTWREEISDEYPGKGEALIAINEYLNWMRSAVDESEDESSEEDED